MLNIFGLGQSNQVPDSWAKSGSFLNEARRIHSYSFSLFAVLVATLVVIPLEYLINNHNLVLIYVLAVAITGLQFGSRAAVLASILSFFSFNYFLTVPRYTLSVEYREELATLIFLLLIALVCGSAASKIRHHIMLLRQANRYSEAMRFLSQELSVAKNSDSVWNALSQELSSALHTEVCILINEGQDQLKSIPETWIELNDIDRAALDRFMGQTGSTALFSPISPNSNWSVFPVHRSEKSTAVAICSFGVDLNSLRPNDSELITAMVQQAANTIQRIRLVEELEAARMETEIEQLRSALLSSVSHDLKSPLAAMMGAAESLRLLDGQITADDRLELTDTILHESRRLESHIQNLLDMTRLGHGSLKIERDWVPVADIIGSAITRLKRYFPEANIEYTTKSTSVLLFVHAALVEQALFNILENAAKFSPSEEKIWVGSEIRSDVCLISIVDQGPGIPVSLREKVFDMFYFASKGDQRKQSTGMGLAICRGMINAHGGTVRASEGFNHKGTRFEIELPINYPVKVDQSSDTDGRVK